MTFFFKKKVIALFAPRWRLGFRFFFAISLNRLKLWYFIYLPSGYYPEFPQAPEPAWGSTKASARDDKAMEAHHYHHPPSGFGAGFAR